MKSCKRWCGSVLLAASILVASGCGGDREHPVIEPWIGEGKTSILVDATHQWEARPDFVFDEHEFRYCHSQSTNRLMANLVELDFRYREIREGPLTDAVLAGHDVLFLNVPTRIKGGRSRPDREFTRLLPVEVEAIVKFVKNGGGLFVVSEHNNAYDHAEVLNPLVTQFGIEVPAAYAVDRPNSKYTIGGSSILLAIRNFKKDHPVNRGVDAISWLGGGPLLTEYGIAFLSDEGHIDFGNYITHKPSKNSNRRLDPGEYKGPGVVAAAAREFGKGRIVMVGDHNMLGAQWLGVADNYRFAVNAFAWLSHRENETPHLDDKPPIGVRLGFDLEHSRWNIGDRWKNGFHPAYINFNRDPDLFAMGVQELDAPVDILGFLDPADPIPPADLDKVAARLARRERVVLIFDPSQPMAGTLDLLRRFVPDLTLTTPEGTLTLDDLKPDEPVPIQRLIGHPLPARSRELGIRGLKIAALHHEEYRGRGWFSRPRRLGRGKPYLLDVATETGQPFISASAPDGHELTVARRVAVGGGELVLMMQSRIWGNETFGHMRGEPYGNVYGSHELQLAFAHWLARQPPVLTPEGGAPDEAGSPPAGDAAPAAPAAPAVESKPAPAPLPGARISPRKRPPTKMLGQ